MKSSDRAILAGLAIVGVLAAFWFGLLSPKREEAATLEDDVAALQAGVAQQEQLIADGEAARDEFDSNYEQLVVLGKAVPEGADTSSLLTQLSTLSQQSKIEFRGLDLDDSSAEAATPPPTTKPPAEEPAPAEGGSTATPAATTTTTPATEASAAVLPIGASVGPAGLPLMPYSMEFRGGFFEFADFLDGLDDMVHSRGERVVVDGRLLTLDGFNFKADPRGGFPNLLGTLAISTYITPDAQGATAGATAAGPAPVASGAAPASGATPAATTPAAP